MSTEPTYSDSLRALAQFMDDYPDMSTRIGHTASHYCCNKEGYLEKLRRLSSWRGGEMIVHKSYDHFANATLDFGNDIKFQIYTSRENVCTKHVEKKLTTKRVPVGNVEYEDVEVEEEVVTWNCPSSLLSVAK